ncbi:flagellar filament capping protein FliD [Salinibacterium sp. SYSU T00001]|uniref:flagellar filament capping protein FliD n=1 Tax=Homoserinimonas sedimenticola TaxID=2986805 RepID=UPI00223579FB|nr:flagellar filament capping protein FliD [Salinibacterium sedimenticola]MCW4385741.1 flagellar filament capping protein FliD [Salinibacterium sedimenticola]
MGISLPGLASGLDSATLISQLMQLEAIPQTLLKNKATVASSTVTVLQSLNTKIASLATSATSVAKPSSIDLYSAKSSSDAVTVMTGTGASSGSLDLVVAQLAAKQTSVSDAVTGWSGELTIDGKDGPVSVTADSLDALVAAINDSTAGVTAMKVSAGKDASGESLYRLQLTSTETGADAAFTVTGLGTTTTGTARDAEVTLWAGTDAEQTVSSKTNAFENIIPGVTVTVGKVSTEPVTVTVARDATAASTVAKGLVSAVSEVLAFIDVRTAVTNSTDANGNPVVSGGSLTGDSTVRSARQSILSAVSMPVDGRSPGEFGITLTKKGSIEFDAEKFAKALAADPEATQAAISSIAQRVQDAATVVSHKDTGTLTTKITGEQSLVKGYNDQIAEWDTRLATRQATLERTYAALEVRMSALNSQSSWLTSQIASLPTYGGNEK